MGPVVIAIFDSGNLLQEDFNYQPLSDEFPKRVLGKAHVCS
jgi:hypothetical protein